MLIILDRDGVINRDSADYIRSPAEWHAIPGSLEAIACLNRAGHTVVVATNQSGVGRGYYSIDMLDAIHDKMRSELAAVGAHVDGIYYCPHVPEDRCLCRKPKPGLLWQIRDDFPDAFSSAVMVGDSVRDIEAAHAAGCQAVWVCSGHPHPHPIAATLHVPIYHNLGDYVRSMLLF